ncbi:MAG: hypothetical protein FJ087_18860 [Deltaproteobacteria bacterium]|nr:hypothetical protein [Deltaproteobacteria bacterium]
MPDLARRGLPILALMLAAHPFLAVTIPPATDLPQHVAQVGLLGEALAGRAPELAVNWIAPGNLGYAAVALAGAVLPPFAAGRVALMLVVLAGVAAAWIVAERRGRPIGAVVLAAALAFNHSLYWGFLPFLAGWPVFLAWVHAVSPASPRPVTARRTALLAGLGLLLYASHALWLAAGVAWVTLETVRRPPAGGGIAARAAALLPAAALAALWYPAMAAARAEGGFDVDAHWFTTPLARLDPRWLADAMLGGIRGPVEAVVAAGVAAWVALGLRTRRRDLREACDGPLVAAGLLLVAVALLGPDKYLNTLEFGGRWFPIGVSLLLLGLPAPAVREWLAGAAAAALLAALSASTTLAWMRFEHEDLSGLAGAIEAVPAGSRVLGLDMVKQSDVVKGRPFVQAPAWVEPVRGARPAFSFAEHSTGLVTRTDTRAPPWTANLEWAAEHVKPSDFGYFDHVIVNGADAVHAGAAASRELEPVTTTGRWRLYRVVSNGMRSKSPHRPNR